MPPPLYEPAMAYDPASRQMILFGGSGSAMTNGTWAWQSGAWRQLHPTHSPSPRQGAALTYDPDLEELVLFGGTFFSVGDEAQPLRGGGANIERTLSDTWVWNGSDWRRLEASISGAQIPPDPQIAWSAADRTLLLDTICNGDCYGRHTRVWSWDPTSESWGRVTTHGAMPYNEAGQGDSVPAALDSTRPSFDPTTNFGPSRAVIADPRSGGLLYVGQGQHNIFGGQEPNPPIDHSTTETWTFRGGVWHPLAPASHPPGALLPTPVLSPTATGDVLMVDGFGQTWQWDGSTWTEEEAASPGVRSGAAMAYDPRSGEVILYGGTGPSPGGLHADTIQWSGTGWSHAAGPSALQPVANEWTQPDPSPQLAISSQAALQRAAFTGSEYRSVQAKLVRNRDLFSRDLGIGGPDHGPEFQPGRLVWVVVGFCASGRPCGISPAFTPPKPYQWTLTTVDAVDHGGRPTFCVVSPTSDCGGFVPGAWVSSFESGPGAAPEGWNTLTDLSTQ